MPPEARLLLHLRLISHVCHCVGSSGKKLCSIFLLPLSPFFPTFLFALPIALNCSLRLPLSSTTCLTICLCTASVPGCCESCDAHHPAERHYQAYLRAHPPAWQGLHCPAALLAPPHPSPLPILEILSFAQRHCHDVATTAICFTICLCISLDLDGYQGNKIEKLTYSQLKSKT
jgi:hypothetical protein